MTRDVRVELVGVAGTGKSTLARTLVARHRDWRIADAIHARSLSQWPYFIHCVPGITQLLGRSFGRQSAVTWDEVKLYVYASEWHRFLEGGAQYRSGVTLFDQGPLFALACLLWGARPVTSSPWFGSWKRATATRWAFELDAVVERIHERAKWHEVKGKPARETIATLAAHRDAYRDVLGFLQHAGGPRLLRFDTSKTSPDEIADELSQAVTPRGTAPVDGSESDLQAAGRAVPARVGGETGLGNIA